jgi:hypothetical protein
MTMGSPLSPVLCNLYLEDLESRALSSFTPKPGLLVRYVDDIFIIWPKDISPLEELLAHFNSILATKKFIVERERKRHFYTIFRRKSYPQEWESNN